MRKILLVLLLLVLVVAYFTKPDDKTCIIEGTRAVWGDLVPNVYDKPDMFEHFMNINSPNVKVNDWLLFKQIKYKAPDGYQTVALGAFKKVFPVVKSLDRKNRIPKAPAAKGA